MNGLAANSRVARSNLEDIIAQASSTNSCESVRLYSRMVLILLVGWYPNQEESFSYDSAARP